MTMETNEPPLRWERIGLVFEPKGQFGWMNTHAQVPTALYIPEEESVRVFFATRPKPGLSLTTFVDLDANDVKTHKYLHPKPILPLGDVGMFDEHGIMPSCVLSHEGSIYLYYSGWSRGTHLPYANFMGLAISEDGGKTFHKIGPGPIVDRTYWSPYSATSPHVVKNGSHWIMFYCSGTGWLDVDGNKEHVYNLKIAESCDGIHWNHHRRATAIPQSHIEEAITRPTVLTNGTKHHMWFCCRGSRSFRGGADSYRLGYASSSDLLSWSRDDDQAGLNYSKEGWDSEMLAYPDICTINKIPYLFYNGNGFGRNGFGAAFVSRV